MWVKERGYPPVDADEPPITRWGIVKPDCGFGSGRPDRGFFIWIANHANACSGDADNASSDQFYFQELYAFWANDGHVAFVVDDVGGEGSYVGQTGPALEDPGGGYCSAQNVTALG